ncbi:hypothetical protein BB559_003377 [Furculomyces boomerangus]|uniref:Large ribosomal subunit protein uL4m n=2 Tax=Harpellales TaxID=61421 RepID=A0A2T9YLR3_9FUNG|nr:hypothetical protein BB559_003377 [Furculomyces boomerangus]PWA00436.1 hypothetical protein BB558_003532 [Smittium angustum]
MLSRILSKRHLGLDSQKVGLLTRSLLGLKRGLTTIENKTDTEIPVIKSENSESKNVQVEANEDLIEARNLAKYGKPLVDKLESPFGEKVQAWLKKLSTNEPVEIIELDRRVFGAPVRVDIVHRVVGYERNAMRQGTHYTRTISDIRGSAKKQAPQKGRGMARVGTRRAPHFRKGAVAHGPRPRSHATKIQRKVWRMGLKSVLSSKYQNDQLVVVDSFELESGKTRDLHRILVDNGWIGYKNNESNANVLFLGDLSEDEGKERSYGNIGRATKNLQGVRLGNVRDTLVYEVLKHKILVLDRKSVSFIENRLNSLD